MLIIENIFYFKIYVVSVSEVQNFIISVVLVSIGNLAFSGLEVIEYFKINTRISLILLNCLQLSEEFDSWRVFMILIS